MATITKTIGTNSRDYSTITAWEADLDNTGVYASQDIAIGQCYNDSEFFENVVINGGTGIPLQFIGLTVPSGHRHNGIAGVGARLRGGIALSQVSSYKLIEWLEIFSGNSVSRCIGGTFSTTAERLTIANVMCHDIRTSSNTDVAAITPGQVGNRVINSVIYNIASSRSGNDGISGYDGATGTRPNIVYNLTVYRVERNSGPGNNPDAVGVAFGGNDTESRARNIISLFCTGTSTGVHRCFSYGSALVQHSNNISEDLTATGTGSFTGILPANLFLSTVSGAENFNLLSTAIAINNGFTVGSLPTGVNIDIRGRDRVANGDTWDIGAYEFVSSNRKLLTLLGVG